jgi:ribulose-phosphate 3-epimerase
VSINPGTSVDAIMSILDLVDLVLVMSVNPGFYGQAFIPSSQDKISVLAEVRKERNLNFHIVVDGGVNSVNAPSLVSAGADVLVAGNSVFKQLDYLVAIQKLKHS